MGISEHDQRMRETVICSKFAVRMGPPAPPYAHSKGIVSIMLLGASILEIWVAEILRRKDELELALTMDTMGGMAWRRRTSCHLRIGARQGDRCQHQPVH